MEAQVKLATSLAMLPTSTESQSKMLKLMSGTLLPMVSAYSQRGGEIHSTDNGSSYLSIAGFYEQQDEQQPDFNNRGLFTSDSQGHYSLRCLVPTPYPIPYDSGAGDILKALDRSPMRPAHIHFLIKAKGYKTLVTQVSEVRLYGW